MIIDFSGTDHRYEFNHLLSTGSGGQHEISQHCIMSDNLAGPVLHHMVFCVEMKPIFMPQRWEGTPLMVNPPQK